MKHLAVYFCVILALFYIHADSTIAQESPILSKLEAPTIYEKAASSVVFITTINAEGQISAGSGVILRSDGIIASNYHVISGAVAAKIQLNNSDIYDDVSIVDTDERKDIAILKIKAVNLPALEVGDSDTIKVGSTVYALGSPRGLTGSLSSGIVSSLRPASDLSTELAGFRIIQFTAPISPGSSGGALLDDEGKLCGLVFAFRPGGQNLNAAIPVNYVAPLAANAKSDGRILKRMPNIVPESSRSVPAATNDIAGVYTGSWSSNQFSVSGVLVMTVSKAGGIYQAKVVFTGSEYLSEETLVANFTEIGEGVWKMDYKGSKAKISGTGLFRGGRFIGDYKFKKFIWVDRGRWVLDK